MMCLGLASGYRKPNHQYKTPLYKGCPAPPKVNEDSKFIVPLKDIGNIKNVSKEIMLKSCFEVAYYFEEDTSNVLYALIGASNKWNAIAKMQYFLSKKQGRIISIRSASWEQITNELDSIKLKLDGEKL